MLRLFLVTQAWCTSFASPSLTVSVVQDGVARPSPLTGFGTEFVFQTNSDVNLNKNLLKAGSRMCRYPGGTPSDYWLWDLGWVNVSSDHSGSGKLPFRPTTPIELRTYLEETAQQTCVFVLNQLQKTLEYALAGLDAHEQAGTPVTHVELGNEMYDATRPDVLAAYPSPSDYADKMANWTAAIKAAYPLAKVALDGLANTWDARTLAWNGQVLQNPVSSGADAATVHLYPGLPPVETFPALLALAFSTMDGYDSYIATTIPDRMEVWVTEWGTWGNENITNTWLQGLWHGTLLSLLPRIRRVSVILPYCASCADPNMPSFVSQYGPIAPVNATDTQWERTPSGHVYATLFSSVTSATDSISALQFAPNPELDPSVSDSRQLVGLLGIIGTDTPKSACILNLGLDNITLAVTGLRFSNCSSSADSISFETYWASGSEVSRQGITVADLQHAVGTANVTGGLVQLPGYSITTLLC